MVIRLPWAVPVSKRAVNTIQVFHRIPLPPRPPAFLTSGAVPIITGRVLPVAGAFALGYEVGSQILRAWHYWNQGLKTEPADLSGADPDGWPQPKPGQVLRWNFARWGRNGASFNSPVELLQYGSATSTQGPPAITNIIPNAFSPAPGIPGPDGYYYKMTGDGGVTGAVPGPVYFRLISTEVLSGDPVIDLPVTISGSPVDRAPLTVPRILPAPPVTTPPATTPKRRDPLAPPFPAPVPGPGNPVPAPPTPAPDTTPGDLPSPGESPGPAPTGWPQQIPFPSPANAPAPRPIGPAGDPITAPEPEVQTTRRDQVNYRNLSVTGTATAPRPTRRAIATELGRMEMKLGGLLGGLGIPEEALDLWKLLELLKQPQPGTIYAIQQPCGTGADGSLPEPIEIEIPDVVGETAAIKARLDAIAQLIAIHKGLPGRVCKFKPVGESVTVTFGEMV